MFSVLQQDIPAEDKLESACEMITITGKLLSQSKEKKTKDTLDGYMARMQRLSESKDLPSRIRFIVSGICQQKQGWDECWYGFNKGIGSTTWWDTRARFA